MTQLFSTAPDLLEDFKQFLPESAAQAKAQAAARAATDEAMTGNVRGDSTYSAGQTAQTQTPRPAAKMPPMGQFDPPSTSKENKKRRGAPGAQSAVPPIPQSAPVDAMSATQGARLGVQIGNANKVSARVKSSDVETLTKIFLTASKTHPYPPHSTRGSSCLTNSNPAVTRAPAASLLASIDSRRAWFL